MAAMFLTIALGYRLVLNMERAASTGSTQPHKLHGLPAGVPMSPGNMSPGKNQWLKPTARPWANVKKKSNSLAIFMIIKVVSDIRYDPVTKASH